MVDDFNFYLLDGHWLSVNTKYTCRLARCWAQPACEFREVVGGMQAVNGIAPMIAIHQVIPVGNEVAEWTAVVAERNAAVHAATRLMIELIFIEWLIHLFPVAQANGNRATLWALTVPLQKSCCLTHGLPP